MDDQVSSLPNTSQFFNANMVTRCADETCTQQARI